MSELELTVNRTISAPRERVFKAWLDPDMIAKFMHVPNKGSVASKVKNEPVKGGRFSIIMINDDKEIPHAGTYLEIDPYSRLVFTWESPYSLDDSVVTIDLVARDAGSTDITLRHVKFRNEGARDGHREGWTAILNSLADIFG